MATGRALFAGLSAGAGIDGYDNLWITDGTSSGTHELKAAGAGAEPCPEQHHAARRQGGLRRGR